MDTVIFGSFLAFTASAASCAAGYFLSGLSQMRYRLKLRIKRMKADHSVYEAERIILRDQATKYVTSLDAEAVRALYELDRLLENVSSELRQAEQVYQTEQYGEFPVMLAVLGAIENPQQHACPSTSGRLCYWRERADQLLLVIRSGVTRSETLIKSIRSAGMPQRRIIPTW